MSRTTASFITAGKQDHRIPEETQRRVQAAAAELGYQPNLTARILRSGKSGTFALVSDFISSTSYANALVRGALEGIRRHDALLYVAETLGDEDAESRILASLIGRRVDGFLYASMFTRVVTIPDALRGVPLVLLNCETTEPDAQVTAVVPDEVQGGATAARALLDVGHRDGIYFLGTMAPGFVGGERWHGWAPLALPRRLEGVERELAAAGVHLAGSPPLVGDWDPAAARAATSGLLAAGDIPKALVCINDAVAVGAFQELRRAGLRVPEDVSLVSFDDSDPAAWLEPGLTSVAIPHADLGREAVEILVDPQRAMGATVMLPMVLHARGSIAPPATR